MQFVCNSCKAKYTISADRVAGKVLKIRCKECGEVIEIRGEGLAAGALLEEGGRKKAQSSKDLSDKYKVSSLRDRFKESFAAKGTGQLPPAAAPEKPPADEKDRQSPVAAARPRAVEVTDPKRWYVSVRNQPIGPVSKTRVRSLLKKGEVLPAALVWREGFDDWKPLEACQELADLLTEIDERKAAAAEKEEAAPGQEPEAGAAAARGKAPPPIGGGREEGAAVDVGTSDPAAVTATDAKGTGRAAEPDAMRGFHVGRIDAQQTVAEVAEAQANLQHDVFRPVATDAERRQSAIQRFMHSRVALMVSGAVALLLGFGVTLLVVTLTAEEEGGEPPPPLVAAVEAPATDHSERGDILAGLTISLDDVIAEEIVEQPWVEELDKNGMRVKKKAGTTDAKAGASGTSPLLPTGIKEKSVSAAGAGSSLGAGKGAGTGQNGLSDDDIRSTVKKNSGTIKKCYEKVLGKGVGVKEDIKVKVRVNVGGSGMVTKAKVTEISNYGNFLTPCIEGAIKGWMFPNAGSSSEFVFPILLTPKT